MMKIFQKKNAILSLTILSTIIFVFVQTATAQQLKPKEIVYSRLPTNLNAAPTGANSPTIWAVGQDGANDRMITSGMEPRISDDGRYLLFRRIVAAEGDVFHYNPYASQAQGQLWVRELANNSETMIFDFSTNGRRLFSYYFSPESNRGDYQIILDYGTLFYKMNIDGTGAVALDPYFGGGVPRENDTFPVLRRGDSLIVANNRDRANFGLMTRTLGSDPPLDLPNTNGSDYNPSWSNDNQFIGFTTLRINGCLNFDASASGCNYPYFFNKISKIKPDGNSRTQLSDLSGNNANGVAFGTIWTEDNSKIIAAARIGGVASLYTFDTDGSGAYAPILISNGNAPDFVGGIVQPREEGQVVSMGGGAATSGNYTLVDTIGEPIAGQTSTGASYTLQSGFWAFAAAPNKTLFDYDGDGKSDVSVFRPSSGVWYLLNSSIGIQSLPFGIATDKITPADFDGDSKTDVAVYRPSNGVWYILKSSGGFNALQFGVAEDVPAPADYDGDGRADIAVFRPSTGAWYILGSTVGLNVTQFGLAGDIPVAADYDGDGKADIAVYRPSSGVWYELRSSAGFSAQQFGTSTDLPTKADYDADGKTDVAVFRPSTGTWYLQQSTAGIRTLQFGQNGDRPAAADYDGDGKADVAVFRPSSGVWYLQRSTAGLSVLQFGQSGDVPTPAASLSALP